MISWIFCIALLRSNFSGKVCSAVHLCVWCISDTDSDEEQTEATTTTVVSVSEPAIVSVAHSADVHGALAAMVSPAQIGDLTSVRLPSVYDMRSETGRNAEQPPPHNL